MRNNAEIKALRNLLIRRVGDDNASGAGELYRAGKPFASVIWSTGGGWDHVSIAPYKRSYTPSWDDMCQLKDMFFYEEEAVMQLHPPKSEYVNNVPNCLHLWRPTTEALPLPPSIMVGIKSGITLSEIVSETQKITN